MNPSLVLEGFSPTTWPLRTGPGSGAGTWANRSLRPTAPAPGQHLPPLCSGGIRGSEGLPPPGRRRSAVSPSGERPADDSLRRTAVSAARCPEEEFLHLVTRLIQKEEAWVPRAQGASLYIGPFISATTRRWAFTRRSRRSSSSSLPVGSYYREGMRPVGI